MRFLVLSTALLALATAAPSGLLPIVALPAAIPTIPPGDLQAAAIDAKVFAEDQARAFADQARALADQAKELAEQATEEQSEKVTESADQAKEKAGEAFWNAEDKKWLAYDSLNTAQAQLDGLAANTSPLLAKSAIGAVVIPPAQFLAPIVVPGIISPKAEAPVLAAKIPEPPKEETPEKAVEVKTADLENKDEKKEAPLAFPGPVALAPAPVALAPAPVALAPAPVALASAPFLAPLNLFPGYGLAPFSGPILTPIIKTW